MKKNQVLIVFILIVGISILMHYAHLHKDIISVHAWRQTQTQSTIQSFYEEDFNILNPKKNCRGSGDGIFRMEFPLTQWIVALLYKIFSPSIFITRCFMFFIGFLSVFGMYKMIQAIFKNNTQAIIGAWAFNFSPSFYYFTINPLPDNLALCFGIWGLAFYFKLRSNNNTFHFIFSLLLLAFSTLCKLPFLLFFSIPFFDLLFKIYKNGFDKKTASKIVVFTISVIIPMLWYVQAIPNWQGNGIVKGVMDNQATLMQLLNYLLFNLFSTLPELLLNYGSVLFFVASFYFIIKKKIVKNEIFILLSILTFLLACYYFFEINMIANVHDYYLFPFYPILFILVSYGAFQLLKLNNSKLTYGVFFLLALLPFTAYLRMKDRWNVNDPGFNKDLLTYKTALQNAVPNNALCIVGNDESNFISFYYIHKKGWCFIKDDLNENQLVKMINEGAKYLYSDSRIIENNIKVSSHFDKLIFEKGSIKIYKLK